MEVCWMCCCCVVFLEVVRFPFYFRLFVQFVCFFLLFVIVQQMPIKESQTKIKIDMNKKM